MNLKRNVEFLFEVGSFRFVERTWKRFLNPDFQNNTEHAFRVAWIALTLAKMEGKGDSGKILKMALLHDLPESRTGDVDYLSRQYTKRDEDLGFADMFFETILAEDMEEIWQEYEKRESIEAKIVKDADTLDVDFELKEQKARGFTLTDEWSQNRQKVVHKGLFTKSAKKIGALIYKSNVHDWHTKSQNNRYKSGDWSQKATGRKQKK